MRKVNLLIANSERRLTNLIESLVLDACYEQAFVDPTRIERADELVKLATSSAYQLIIVAADNLTPGPGLRRSWVSEKEAVHAIAAIHERDRVPIIAVAVNPEDELPLLQAGAESVIRLPYQDAKLKLQSEVRRLLNLAEPAQAVEVAAPRRSSFGELVVNAFRRFKSA